MAKTAKKRKPGAPQPGIEELRQYLRIDRNALDSELEMQPVLYDQVSSAVALSRSRMDEAKYNVDQVEAEVSDQIRRTAEAEGDRVTEKGISDMIKKDKDVKKAVKEYLRLKFETEELEQLRESFRQRNYMLRELASLYIAGYYQSASVSSAKGSMKAEKAERNRERMAERRRLRSGGG